MNNISTGIIIIEIEQDPKPIVFSFTKNKITIKEVDNKLFIEIEKPEIEKILKVRNKLNKYLEEYGL